MKTLEKAGIALLALLATACADDDAQRAFGPVAVNFSTNINLTRAADTSWESGDRIGIFMLPAGSAEAAATGANKRYCPSPANNSLAPDGVENTLYFPEDGSAVDFLAYYPYRELTDLVCPIDVSDQSRQNAIDFLYAERIGNRTQADPNIAFVFEHRLSKLILEVGTTTPGTDLSTLTARIDGMNTAAAFDLTAGTLGEGSAPASITMYRSGNLLEATLLPAALTGACSVEFTLDGETFVWKIAETIPVLVGGHKYIYRVTLTPETPVLVPAGVTGTITDWIPEDTGDVTLRPGGVSYRVGDYYPDPAVDTSDPTAVAMVEGIVFAVSDGGKHGKMLSLSEGSGLQWSTTGAKDDTLDENDGRVNFEIIRAKDTELTAYPAFAWCASLGEGWYIPAVNELLALRTAWGATNAEKEAFNARIAAVNGEPLKAAVFVAAKGSEQSVYYYTSTEKADAANKVLSVSFNSTAGASDGLKKSSNSAENLLFRAIKTF